MDILPKQDPSITSIQTMMWAVKASEMATMIAWLKFGLNTYGRMVDQFPNTSPFAIEEMRKLQDLITKFDK